MIEYEISQNPKVYHIYPNVDMAVGKPASQRVVESGISVVLGASNRLPA